MEIQFGSVIYREAELYFDDFINSLRQQSAKNFSIYLLNDNYSPKELLEISKKAGSTATIDTCAAEGAAPSKLRIELLRRMKRNGTKLLISGDCDDYFSTDRVAFVRKAYLKDRKAAFYYNQIVDFEGKPVLADMPDRITDDNAIREYNFLGLSNTAVNLSVISEAEIDSLGEFEGNVFDWYFFSRLLLLGKYGVKTEGGSTFYRIHAENLAGMPTDGMEAQKKEIAIKRNHYYWLKKYDACYEKKYNGYCNGNLIQKRKDSGRYWWDLTSCSPE